MSYEQFVATKLKQAPSTGIDKPKAINKQLFPFQQDIVRWALRRGRAACFADCGMGKTAMQLEWARHVAKHTGGEVLILAPLAVAQQTVREGAKFKIDLTYCRRPEQAKSAITIANYEMLERFDPARYAGVVIDESSILKSYDGKTRTAIIEAFAETQFRLACTATPAPNDFMELGNHAEFLGVMTRPEMLSMYFVHDGGTTQDWRIKGHAEAEFWRWVCQWAVMVRKPSDLGYSDDGFVLPPLEVHEHVVPIDHVAARKTGMLFALEANTLAEQREVRRATIDERVRRCADLVAATPGEPWLIWCELNAEASALERAIPGAVQISGSDDHATKEDRMNLFTEGVFKVLVTKPSIAGHGLNWQHASNMAFVGIGHSFEQYYQAVRREWRFGQRSTVKVHVITAETEGRVVANLRRKEADAQRMADAMVANMRDMQKRTIKGTARDSVDYKANESIVIPAWMESDVA